MRSKIGRLVLGSIAVVGVATACTTTRDVPGPTRTKIQTVTRTVAPQVTTWTVSEAGAHYLALVKPSNQAMNRFRADGKHHPTDLKLLKRDASKIADADDVFLRGLVGGRWPAQALPAVHALETAIGKERAAWSAEADSDNFDDFNAVKLYDGSGAAEQVRVVLGLPGTS